MGPWMAGAIRVPKNGAGRLGLVASSLAGAQPQILLLPEFPGGFPNGQVRLESQNRLPGHN
jgi:hypothetical protein